MSLNSDVLDDIDGTGVIDNEIIKSPSPIPSNKNSVNIIAKTPDLPNSISKMSENDLNQLPNLDVSFQIIKDNSNRVIELEDVESEILAQESINRTDAITIDDVFKGLLGSHIKLEEFTQTPSKTNFVYVKHFMETRIAQEQQNVISSFQTFFDGPLNAACEVLNKLTSEHLDSCYFNFRDIYNNNKGCLQSVVANKNAVIIYGDEFKNVVTIPIGQLDVSKIGVSLDNKQKLSEAVENIKNLFSDNIFNSFIFGSMDGKSATDSLTYESITQYNNSTVDGQTLFKIFETLNIIDNIEQLRTIIADNVKYVSQLKEEFNADVDNYESVNKFLIKNNLQIQNLIKSVKNISSLVFGVNNLCLNSGVLLEFYKKL